MSSTPVEHAQLGLRAPVHGRVWAITAAYATISSLWIYASDHALQAIAPDPATLVEWSVYKGVVFVAFTSAMLFVLMRRAFASIERSLRTVQAHEAEIEKVNRWLTAVRQVNSAILRENSRPAVLPRVCAALVEHGKARCAWIALKAADGALHCAAIAGSASGAFDPELAQQAVTFPDRVVRNRLAATGDRGWESRAAAAGYRSVAAVALRCQGEICGCLAVLSDVEDEFSDKELAFVDEVATDLSLALDTYSNEEAKRQAREQADNERSFSAAMIESLPGVVYFYDRNGRFLRWNRNFALVSGYSDDEIATMHPLQFFGPRDRERVADRIVDVFERGEASVEAGFLTKSGRSIPYLFTGRQVALEGEPCLVGMGIDVTAREEAVNALRQLNETLEARVTARTAELSAALVRAEEADRLKSAFLATMSHELRTPLNSIIGFTGILLRGLAGPLNEEQHKQLGMVRASARHLLELINDILDLSKIEAGQLQIRRERFSVQESVQRVLGMVQPLAHAKNLDLACDGVADVDMHGDQRRLEQILLNLLNNAVKFTDRGGIRLEVEGPGASGGPGSIIFKVHDTGIGIRDEDLALLFKPFRQVDDGLARQREGTGLGLAICRRLAQLMGGAIEVQSRVASGSTFILTLPREAP
jgi:PAS domain S-box-containing protein